MSETIPDDIMQVSENVYFDASIAPTDAVALEIITRAILAERERCAKAAADAQIPDDGLNAGRGMAIVHNIACQQIEAAIRTPSTASTI